MGDCLSVSKCESKELEMRNIHLFVAAYLNSDLIWLEGGPKQENEGANLGGFWILPQAVDMMSCNSLSTLSFVGVHSALPYLFLYAHPLVLATPESKCWTPDLASVQV